MALSNIYKPQTNKFSHMGSDEDDDDDEDSEELDDEFDDSYSKNFTALHSSKPLMQPHNKTKIRRVRSRPWCTTKSCFMCFMWLAFFSICVSGLVFLILRGIDAVGDSKGNSVKKVLQSEREKGKSKNVKACDKFSVKKVWHATFPKLMTETPVRLNDVNEDGVKDIIISFATGVDGYNVPRFACDLYFNGTFPCFGGALALDGKTGEELWRHYSMHEVYGINCNADIDQDGVRDCLLSGRGGVFEAITSKTGKLLWRFGPQPARNTMMNLYTAQFVRDLDGDGVLDIIVAHGGDPMAEAHSVKRLVGRLLIFSGKTGKVLRWVKTPDERETYFSVNLYTKKDGTDMVVFGTGGETHPGGLFVISLIDLYRGYIEKAKQIYEDKFKGAMVPPVLVDVNKDGTVDIAMAMFNTTFIVFDGESYKELWRYSFPQSESYSTPAAGLFNKDDTPDFLVRYNYGQGFPSYFHSQVTVIDGKTGNPIVKPSFKSSVAANTSPLTVSMEGEGNDLFAYWVADCIDHEGEGGEFEFVEGTNVHEQSRADTCQLRYHTNSFSRLSIMNRRTGFPGQQIYHSEKYWPLEHDNFTSSSSDANRSKSKRHDKPRKKRHLKEMRSKRHIGAPDHGGFQRLIATGGIAPSLSHSDSKEPSDSIDIVFSTYWQYPAKVRIVKPEDKACIERYRKLAKLGKFNNSQDIEENEKLGIYDAGDTAVNICLKKHEKEVAEKQKNHIYISQSDFDWYKIHFGSMTVYRFEISCSCDNVPPGSTCSRFLPMNQQGWGGYMGTLGNGYYVPRD